MTYAEWANDVGLHAMTEYRRTNQILALLQAVHYLERAASAADLDAADRAPVLGNLGLALRTRFERTGDEADLRAAIICGQHSPDHPNRARYQGTLAHALYLRFERSRHTADLQAATKPGVIGYCGPAPRNW